MLKLFLFIGLLGAILMYIGDMVLYFSRDAGVSFGTINDIIDIMKKESWKRLYTGGIIGPIAAFLYCIGYYHLVLIMNDQYQVLGWICFFINCLGIICGGAYHSHCAYLGLIGRHEHKESMNEIIKYLGVQKYFVFGLQGIGFLALAVFIVCGWTVMPRWMFFFSPGILFFFAPLTKKLPKGLNIAIGGGWTNWISIIYYALALITTYVYK